MGNKYPSQKLYYNLLKKKVRVLPIQFGEGMHYFLMLILTNHVSKWLNVSVEHTVCVVVCSFVQFDTDGEVVLTALTIEDAVTSAKKINAHCVFFQYYHFIIILSFHSFFLVFLLLNQ